MTNRIRTHIPADPAQTGEMPKHMTKQEFARRLYTAMLAKGWNQAEIARQSGLSPDNISAYMRAMRLPTPQSLQRLGDALGVPPESLLGNQIERAFDHDAAPPFEIKTNAANPDVAWLRVNRMVPLTVALKIAEILANVPDPTDRNRGGSSSSEGHGDSQKAAA